MLRDPIIQNLYPEIFEFEEAVDVIGCLKEWPKSRLCDDKAIARKTKIDIKTVKDILKLLETNNFVHEEIAKKVKLDLEIVDQFIEENESLLLETKKTYSQQTLKTLNDNLNAIIKGEKKEENDEEAEDKKEEEANAEEVKDESSDDDKKVMNEDKGSDEVVVKEAVEETSEDDEKAAKKSKAKKPKKEKAKKRAVNQKFWYLTFDEIIDCLKNGYTTDEEISEKTNCKLNIVRKILYKLYDMRLASYKRDKDKRLEIQ